MKGEKPAQQARSKQSRGKIVAALERLLRAKPFEAIAVHEIASEAGLSVGAFYRRFENKDALIPVIFDLYAQASERRVATAQGVDPQQDLASVIRQIMRDALAVLREEAHLLRAAHLYSRLKPELVGEEWEAMVERSRQGMRALVAAYAEEITHPDRDAAAETLTYFFNTSLIEAVLYDDVGVPIGERIGQDALAEELADMAIAYLTRPRG